MTNSALYIRAAKREKLVRSLRAKAAELKALGKIEAAWLFGSYARGDWSGVSDVDILCMSSLDKESIDFNIDKEIDLLVVSKDEFDRRYQGNSAFRDIVNGGIPL